MFDGLVKNNCDALLAAARTATGATLDFVDVEYEPARAMLFARVYSADREVCYEGNIGDARSQALGAVLTIPKLWRKATYPQPPPPQPEPETCPECGQEIDP